MAVQQNRKTPSKRNMRRSHDALGYKTVSTDQASGKRHLRHHVGADGFYRGKLAIIPKVKKEDQEIETEE